MQVPDASTLTHTPGLSSRWRFLLIAGILYAVWLVCYENNALPRYWLDQELCYNLAANASKLLRLLGFVSSPVENSRIVYMNGQPAVSVGTPCNGMALYALFSGFIIAFPGPWRPKLWFVPAGVTVIYLLNILRIAVLALNYYYAHESVDFNHHYTFTFIVYGCIGAMWMLWVRRYGPASAANA